MTNFFSWRSAFKKSDINSTTKLVLFCISTYMNDDGKGAFPSIKTLMADASLSNKAVIKHIKLAEEMGYIKVSKLGLAGQKWRQNNYEIAFPELNKVVNEVHLDSSEGGEPQSKGGEPQGNKVVNEVHTITPMNSPLITPTTPISPNRENQLSIAKPNSELKSNSENEIAKSSESQVSAAVNLYFDLADKHNLPKIQKTTAEIQRRIKACIKALEADGSSWYEFLQIIDRSPHLIGKSRAVWCCWLQWIIKPKNFDKIRQGIYLERTPQHQTENVFEMMGNAAQEGAYNE